MVERERTDFAPRRVLPKIFRVCWTDSARQIAWMSEARHGDIRVVRACSTSHMTTGVDIPSVVVAEMNRVVAPEERYAGTGQRALNQ